MPGFGVIQNISVELRQQIFDALESTPDTDFNLGESVDRISLQSPSEMTGGDGNSPIASLYLYHIEIDKHLRNQPPLPDRARDDEYRKPPLPLKLRYLFTPEADEETYNQLLLGRVLQHFHDFPDFSTVSGQLIGDAIGGASPEIRVKPDLLSIEQLSQLWSAFSEPYRIALSLVVEVVAVDSGQPPHRRRRVGEFITGIGEIR